VFSPTEGVSVEVSGKADIVQLFLDQTSAQVMLDAPFACPPMFDLRDDWMRTMIMRILMGSARPGPDDALKMDEDLHALALRLERHASQWRGRIGTPSAMFRGGLAPGAFRKIEAIISTAIDEATSPSLAQMADAVGLSVTHFARAFRRHTGSTRATTLCAAVSLLRVAEVSVAEVADKVGFATPAHFVATLAMV
jgi:AraC family transcriptional regulator